MDDRRARRAWMAAISLIAATCAWQGAGPSAGAAETEEAPSTCAGGEVTLPSGATLCQDASDGGAVTSAEGASVLLRKTVGTNPKVCADTTGITITTASTRVIYCYTIENTGTIALTEHDLVDDKLGTLIDGLSFDLQPGAKTFATASATLPGTAQTIVNTATWTATNGVDTAESSAQATVNVEDGAAAPTPVTAKALEGEATVTWAVPATSGGYPITGYQITRYEDDAAVETIEVPTSPRSRTFTGLPNGSDQRFDVRAITEVGLGAVGASPTVSVDWWLPWSTATKAGTEIYTWLTGKAPTASQLSAFISAGNAGTLPGTQIDALRDGPDATGNVDPVVRLYSAYFLRPPDRSGFDFWVNRRRSGAWTVSRISANFAGSSEFKNRYGNLSNSAFVSLVYDNVLGRAPDAAGLSYWTGQLDSGKRSRGQVMANFSESSEYKRKSETNVDAISIAIQLLGTSPSASTVASLVSEIDGSSLPDTIRRLLREPSFDARAG